MLDNKNIGYVFNPKGTIDFLINDCVELEVKSAQLSVKNGHGARSIGRFDFTAEEQRARLKNAPNAWVCFILQVNENIVPLGVARGARLPNKRYITLHDIQKLKLLELHYFLRAIAVKKYGKNL